MKFCINNEYIKLLSLISIFALCFSVISLGSAAKSTYYDNPGHSDQNNTLNHGIPSIVATFAYSNPARVIIEDANSMTVLAYPSSYWDDWSFKAYYVTWPKNVWIDQINGDNCQDTTPVTIASIEFNNDIPEGELSVVWSADGRHNGCDFSAITGFEKETSWTHLSIWKSRGSYPVAA
jgi:hypothetical protein